MHIIQLVAELRDVELQVMQQMSPLAWKYLRTIEIILSKDTSEIVPHLHNLCKFSKWPPETHIRPIYWLLVQL